MFVEKKETARSYEHANETRKWARTRKWALTVFPGGGDDAESVAAGVVVF